MQYQYQETICLALHRSAGSPVRQIILSPYTLSDWPSQPTRQNFAILFILDKGIDFDPYNYLPENLEKIIVNENKMIKYLHIFFSQICKHILRDSL